MQFSNFTRVEEGNKISFYTKNPLKGISSIKYFKDNATGNFSKKEFRWSFNSDYWSAWTPLNQGNLAQIKIAANQNIFLEIRYFSNGNGVVTEFELFYTGAAQSEISAGSCPPDSKYSKIDKTVPTEVYIPSQCNSEPGCTDALTLCGKSCDYYLWRPNHKGQQPISSITDLQTILNNLYNAFQNIEVQGAENIAGDGIGVFYELNNKILYFKRINAGYGLNISELDGTITLTVDPSLSTKDPSINQLYDLYGILESEINDLSTYTNSQFIQIDSSITDLYFKYWNSESSIGELYDFYNLLETNISDISIYVDSKFAEIDSSIIDLYSKYWDVESSINDLYTKYWNSEASINELYSLIGDTSVKWLENVGPGAEVLKEIDGAGIGKFRTLVGGGDVSIVEQGDQITIYIDASYSGEVNYGVNLGGGDASVYFGKSLEALQFREIKGIGSVVVSTSDNLILIDSSGSAGTYDTSLDPSLAMPTSVGGIPAGTTVNSLKGDSFIQLFDSLLFPTVNPTYVAPNNSFAYNVANLQEIGASINITFTAGFNRGQILLNSVFQNYRSGLPNSYSYTGSGLPGAVPSTSLSNIQNLVGYTVLQGNQSWANTVSYDIGPQPLDSKGNPYGSPLAAGTTSAKTVSFEGVYPLFGTTALISNPDTKQSLVSMISANNIVFNMISESGGYKQSFDLPNSWIGSRPLLGIETFNSFALSWEYQGGTAIASLAFWSSSSVTQNIQGNVIPYTRYTYNGIDRSSIQIRLKF